MCAYSRTTEQGEAHLTFGGSTTEPAQRSAHPPTLSHVATTGLRRVACKGIHVCQEMRAMTMSLAMFIRSGARI